MKTYSIKRTVDTQYTEWVSVEAENEDQAKELAKYSGLEVVHSEPGFCSIVSIEVDDVEDDFDLD